MTDEEKISLLVGTSSHEIVPLTTKHIDPQVTNLKRMCLRKLTGENLGRAFQISSSESPVQTNWR
jgi:hypothetical protein